MFIRLDTVPALDGLTELVKQYQVLRALHDDYCFRQFFRDALPLIGTTSSVSVMRSLIASQQASPKEIDIWLTSLAFVKNPTRHMMRELKVCIVDDICIFGCYCFV